SASTTSSLIAPCLTDKGIALQDVYLGPAGVLTGSAQLAQEAHEEAEEQQQRYEIAQLVRLDDLVQDYLSLVRVNQMQLQPQDMGSGIPAERLERIFEPLYTTKPGGTGLGLYIVQEIVTAHGGQITVQSIEGQGTTFSITLPRVPAEAPVPAGFPDPRITLGR